MQYFGFRKGQTVEIIGGNLKYQGKQAKVIRLLDYGLKNYHAEVQLDNGKELVYRDDEIKLVLNSKD